MFLLIPFGGILLGFGYALGYIRNHLHNREIGGSNFGGGTDSHASAVSRRANVRFADIGLRSVCLAAHCAIILSALNWAASSARSYSEKDLRNVGSALRAREEEVVLTERSTSSQIYAIVDPTLFGRTIASPPVSKSFAAAESLTIDPAVRHADGFRYSGMTLRGLFLAAHISILVKARQRNADRRYNRPSRTLWAIHIAASAPQQLP